MHPGHSFHNRHGVVAHPDQGGIGAVCCVWDTSAGISVTILDLPVDATGAAILRQDTTDICRVVATLGTPAVRYQYSTDRQDLGGMAIVWFSA